MVPRVLRLARDQFTSLFRAGRVFRGTYCAVHYLPASSLRTAVIVPKKVIKQATDRHRYKRIIHNMITSWYQNGDMKKKYHLAVRLIKRPETEKDLSLDVQNQLDKI